MRIQSNPSGHNQSSADSIAKGKSGTSYAAVSKSPLSFNGLVAQTKIIDINPHGEIWVPDDINLEPDAPVFGDTNNVGSGLLAHPAATSMESLITPAHPQGSEPKALDNLFNGLPTKGNYKLQANAGKAKDGSTLYIKGHLLNDNLGGPGTAENLFPITHQANVDHNNKVEEPIKDHVNKEGGAIHYEVTVANIAEGTTALYDCEQKTNFLKYVDADFICTIKEYKNDKTVRARNPVTIKSRWGATDNSDVDNLALFAAHEHGTARDFDALKVKLMPRAKAKEEWDKNYMALALGLANIDGVDFTKWMNGKVKGLGKEGLKLLEQDVDYETLNKNKKATLTKARALLKDFLETNYANYMTVTAGYDEEVQDTVIDLEAIVKQEHNTEMLLREVDTEIDLLTIQFGKLSIKEKAQADPLLYKTVIIIRNPEEPQSFNYKGYRAEVREHAAYGKYQLMLEVDGRFVVFSKESFRLA